MDEQMLICKIGPASIVREVLCVGDQVTFINSHPVSDPEDAVHRLRAAVGKDVSSGI